MTTSPDFGQAHGTYGGVKLVWSDADLLLNKFTKEKSKKTRKTKPVLVTVELRKSNKNSQTLTR